VAALAFAGAAFFAENGVGREGLRELTADFLLAGDIHVGDQVDHAFVADFQNGVDALAQDFAGRAGGPDGNLTRQVEVERGG